jgi:hypothetical protein
LTCLSSDTQNQRANTSISAVVCEMI